MKKPAAVVKKQHKPEGLGPITKFFDPRPPSRDASPQGKADGAQVDSLRGAAVTPPAPTDALRAPPVQGGFGWRPKHMMDAADAYMMSQDTDALCVVWHDSPSAAGLALGTAPAGAAAAAVPGQAPPGPQRQNFDAIKQRLISAAQRPRGQPAARLGQPLLARQGRQGGSNQTDALLEGLFSHEQHRPVEEAGVAAGSGPEGSVFSAGLSDVTGATHTTHKTPAAHLKGILKKPQSAGRGQRVTPSSNVKFNLAGGSSTAKLAAGRSAKQATTANKKRQSGQKRKALLELLEQVESLVQSGGGSSQEQEEEEGDPGSQDKENSQQVNSQDCQPSAAVHKAGQVPAGAEQQAVLRGGTEPPAPIALQQHAPSKPLQQQSAQQLQQGVAASNRFIPPAQSGPRGTVAGHGPFKPQASQQPPPQQQGQGPMRGAQQGMHGSQHMPLQPTAHCGPLPFPSITTGVVPQPRHQAPAPAGLAAQRSTQACAPAGGPGRPSTAALGGLSQPAQQQAQRQQLPSQQQAVPNKLPAQQQAVPNSSGFGSDDMDDDDSLAELELQLVTQLEQQHAAARQALAQRAAGATGGGGPGNAHPSQAAIGASGPAPAPAGPVQSRPAPVAPKPAGPVAPAAAPHQPLQAAAAVVGQEGPAPAQPAAAPIGSEASAGAPPAPAQTGAGAAPIAAAATTGSGGGGAVAMEASDSWGDDDDDFLDTEMLAQAEAAALEDQAKRRSSGGSSGNRQQASAAPQHPKFPGDRENVNYSITEIINNEHDQILRLYNKHKGREVFAHLRTPWTDLPYRVGDAVSLVARLDEYNGQYHCLLDMDNGLLVLHPDVLLSGTRITGSNNCPRQSILDEKIAGDGSSAVALKGTLQHSLIQAALAENLSTARDLHRKAEEIVAASAEALLEVEMDEAGALAYLKEATPGILRWMSRFLKEVPGQDSLVTGGFDPMTNREIVRSVAVQEVVDIEESVWATKFGVKGMIDVSVKMALQDSAAARQRQPQQPQGWMQSGAVQRPQQPAAAAPGLESLIAPIEIKTGKPHDSHRAQVLLYLLLMEERYGKALDWGMLWYTTQPNPQLVRRKPHELSSLMAVRNRLAAYIAHNEMAPLADYKKQCHWCFQKHHCALYHKAIEGGTVDTFKHVSTDRSGGDPHNVASIFEKQASHLSPADCEFLKKWAKLIDLEEGGTLTRRAEIWSVPAEERERQSGRCLARLALQHVDEGQGLYTFRRADGGGFSQGGALAEGEMVVLSMEGQHVTVARAVIYALTTSSVTVSLRKPLRRGLLLPAEIATGVSTTQPSQQQQQQQAQQQHAQRQGSGPVPMAQDGPAPAPGVVALAGPAGSAEFDPSVRWRLDKDDVSSTFVKLRLSLFSLFRPEDEHAAKLRRLIVDLSPPEAAPLEGIDPTPAAMNHEQHEAVHRVLAAKDYTLVLGMPGAGKTTTIVSMVRALVAQGKSVLVTSYTNSAVDNILVKLAGEGVPFVRLGQEKSVHPAVLPYVPGGEKHPHRTVAALRQLGETIPVVGATCFGMSHAMLKNKIFDVCILDEAGQVTLPASLGPLLKSKAFVLVGDHNQLPPLVANREAEEGGMGVSLFKMLSDAHPEAVVSLPVQYRMAADIQELANQLFYNNQLRCGTPAVAAGVMALPPHGLAALPTLPVWVQQVLAPERRVLFLDTADVGAQESLAGETLSNTGEAGLVLQVLQGAAAVGVGQDRMGVISPYRAQVSLLERLTKEGGLPGVECLTVDKCQGRDKDCIVVSFVRSNEQREAGKLLQDWRRINVAVTRAKSKLVLVGNSATLSTLPLFQRLLGLVQGRGWYMHLPPGACSGTGSGS